VEVSAEAPLVETGSATVGKVIENRRIEELPLNGRNGLALVMLTPSVKSNNGPLNSGFVDRGAQLSGITINGGPSGVNNMTLDGGINNNNQYGEANISPTVDSIEEFKVQTGTMPAEFGRTAGGVVNIVTKSGTNQFHGTLYEFLRNDVLQAQNVFASSKAPLRYNQYGGSIGGPIRRDKTFFFFNLEGFRFDLGGDPIGSVPTADWRQGNFSNLRDANGTFIPIYNPLSTVPNPNGSGFVREPFMNNSIPGSMLDKVSQNVLNAFYPLPNRTASNPFTQSNNYENPAARNPREMKQFIIKGDHRFSSADNLTVRFNFFDHHTVDQTFLLLPVPALYRDDFAKMRNGLIREIHTFSPHMINEFTGSVTRQRYDCPGFSANSPTKGPLSTPGGYQAKLGLPGDPIGLIPTLNIAGGYSLATYGGTCLNYSLNYSFSDNLTYILGNHTLKFGGDYQRLRSDFFVGGSYSYTFPQTLTGNPQAQAGTGSAIASFVFGAVSTATSTSIAGGGRVGSSSSVFAQDDWKVNRRLTLNIGIRYDYPEWPHARNLATSNFNPFAVDPVSGLMGRMEYGADFGGTPYQPDYLNIAPRFGFAYDLLGKGKTVVRGGYGIYYPNVFYNQYYPSTTGFTSATTSYNPAGGNTNIPAFQFQNGVPSPPIPLQGANLGPSGFLGQSVTFDESNKKVPMSQQWNFTVQQQLPGQWLIEAGYIGNHGTHFVATTTGYDYNQLDPQYLSQGLALQQSVSNPYAGKVPGSLGAATITRQQLLRPYPYYQNITVRNPSLGNFMSHQAVVTAQKRLTHGMVVLVSYTMGKIIDNSIYPAIDFDGLEPPSGTGNAWQNGKFDRNVERGLDSGDVSQRLVVSGVYELPFGSNKRFRSNLTLVNKLIGGWQVNLIAAFQSGTPLVIRGANNQGTADRPNSTGQSAALSNPTQYEWFNTQAFVNPPNFTFGNLGRVLPDVRAPGVENYDLSLVKNTAIKGERWRLQFRAEAFNLLNHVNLLYPDVTFVPGANGLNSSATFGTITGARDPRTFQLAMKLLF
jgi:outer membrane receptor protein involved in Fe transport